MKKTQAEEQPSRKKKLRPALTPEARENQLINLAMNRAEEKLLDGTASSQLITHFLKLGSTREQLEREKLEKENELLRAKAEALQSAARMEELYEKAIDAMRSYGGMSSYEEDPDI